VSEHAAKARAVVDANRYMTLATADGAGRPWVSPVWFASADRLEFFWVSSPDARHSRNLSGRREVAIVIFDSRVPVGDAEAVYIAAAAAQATRAELAGGIDVFSRASLAQGLPEWTRADVVAPARHRLYRAVASEHFVLGPRDQKISVSAASITAGARAPSA
jgi:nitroimidazol reductase NimA-like FMN-containing flavoprotein (pyridoxamine 5'-phosphate oxidase superfamily)